MIKILKTLALLAALIVFKSCGKGFLEVKRDASQVVPSQISDYQALLDRNSVMNFNASVGLALIGAEEFYVKDEIFRGLEVSNPVETMAYTWSPDLFRNDESRDWNNAYQRILHANLALDVEIIKPEISELDAWKNVKGSALFYRAINYYHLAQLFCVPYDPITAYSAEGLPLRKDYDISIIYHRSSVGELYDLIIDDLMQAVELLPEVATPKMRPSKIAALTLLAIVNLNMGNYSKSREYCERALEIRRDLIDFNTLDTNQLFTFESDYAESHSEVVFFMMDNQAIMTTTRMNVDEEFLNLYTGDDLRRKLYFRQEPDGRTVFKGSYSGQNIYFVGLALDEVFLTLAECHVRLGDIHESIIVLNEFMSHRYEERSFSPIVAPLSSDEILQLIILERRKQLYMRGTRWVDHRRLNEEPQFATSLIRYVNGESHLLHPTDSRWVWPLPHNEVQWKGTMKFE